VLLAAVLEHRTAEQQLDVTLFVTTTVGTSSPPLRRPEVGVPTGEAYLAAVGVVAVPVVVFASLPLADGREDADVGPDAGRVPVGPRIDLVWALVGTVPCRPVGEQEVRVRSDDAAIHARQAVGLRLQLGGNGGQGGCRAIDRDAGHDRAHVHQPGHVPGEERIVQALRSDHRITAFFAAGRVDGPVEEPGPDDVVTSSPGQLRVPLTVGYQRRVGGGHDGGRRAGAHPEGAVDRVPVRSRDVHPVLTVLAGPPLLVGGEVAELVGGT